MAKKTASPHESSSKGNQIAITVTEKGPYLVTGNPPLAMQFIMPDSEGESWYFQEGRHFSTEKEPTALCRCGLSRSKPYCDGSHPFLPSLRGCLGPDGRIRRFAVPQAGRPRSFDVSERPPDRLGQPHGKTLRIHLRTQPGIDRRPGDRRQRRTLGTRRDPHPTRRRPNLRSSEQGSALPLRTLPQQALLRRCACRRQMERRAGGNPQWRNAPPKRCQCENRNPLTGLPFHSNKIESTGTLYGLARHTSAPKRDAPFYNTLR